MWIQCLPSGTGPVDTGGTYNEIPSGVQGQEDTVISITPALMGLADDEGEPFNIYMRDIREALETLEVVRFVPALGDEM